MQRKPSLLASAVFYRTYAATLPSGKKESYEQTVTRVMEMHLRKFPFLAAEIEEAFEDVYERRCVPSMRSMQFAGAGIERENARMFNCAFANLTDFQTFSELFYLLLCGTGTGYSVQRRHINRLPIIRCFTSDTIVIPDTKEGWADSAVQLLANPLVHFDYSQIRPKGAPISSGGTASGPEPLQLAHKRVRAILREAVDRRLLPIECHDIMCHLADAVIVGGVRRSAMISLFDFDDLAMLTAKAGGWWVDNPQRGRANNSAVIHRDDPFVQVKIRDVMEQMVASKAGEPGYLLTNDYDWGTNPCGEIALRSHQFCNLTEVIVPNCVDADALLCAARSAGFIGTLQASYTDFNYLRPVWKETTDAEALLGVSLTGIAQMTPKQEAALPEAAWNVLDVNRAFAPIVGVNLTARATTVKPSGSTSAVMDCDSGVHASHAPYFVRGITIDKDNPLGVYLSSQFPIGAPDAKQVLVQHVANPDSLFLQVPVHRASNLYRRDDVGVRALARIQRIYENWIRPGHVSGVNTHNVSATVSYRDDGVPEMVDWLCTNRNSYQGLSFLAFDGGTYVQAPFTDCTKDEYDALASQLEGIDLDFGQLNWANSADTRKAEFACAGGMCEIT